jgi:hypothetical protein
MSTMSGKWTATVDSFASIAARRNRKSELVDAARGASPRQAYAEETQVAIAKGDGPPGS